MTEIKYDQHFLEDDKIIELTIKEANITNEDIIFEIGSGKGILTKAILEQNPKQLISVELDNTFKNNLQILEKYPNFKLIFSNALKEMPYHTFTKLIANIPYAITEPLYKQIIEQKIPFAILLHGITFYYTIIVKESKWNIYINAFYNIKLLKEVNGKSFNPPTKTKSVLIKLEKKQSTNIKELFIQNLFFKQKSKTINALCDTFSKTFKLTKKESKLKTEELNLDIKLQNKILETLSNKDFAELIEKVNYKNF